MSNLAQRVVTAFFGAGILIAAYIFSAWTFGLVTILLSIFILHEFYSLARKNGYYPFTIWGLLFSSVLFALLFLLSMDLVQSQVLWILPALLTTCFLFPLYANPKVHPINCLGVTLMGIIYVGIPMAMLNLIAFKTGAYEYEILLAIFFAQWANDTGGYFVGKNFGKTKLFEKVSPNKTWEGSIGGAVLALAVMYGWSQYFSALSLMEWIGLGFIIVIFGSLGDLVESLFKRTLAIKDSGTVLKGHGGFLDRFDGLIIAIPFATAYLMLVL